MKRLAEREEQFRKRTKMSKRRFRFVLVLLFLSFIAINTFAVLLGLGKFSSSPPDDTCSSVSFVISDIADFERFKALQCKTITSLTIKNLWFLPWNIMTTEQNSLHTYISQTSNNAIDYNAGNWTQINSFLSTLRVVSSELNIVNCSAPSLVFTSLESVGFITLDGSPLIVNASFPVLTRISADLFVQSCFSLARLLFPSVTFIGRDLTLLSLPGLHGFVLPEAESVFTLLVSNCELLSEVTLPKLTSAAKLTIANCHSSVRLFEHFSLSAPLLSSVDILYLQQIVNVHGIALPSLVNASNLVFDSLLWGKIEAAPTNIYSVSYSFKVFF